jgi:hypothetical protein
LGEETTKNIYLWTPPSNKFPEGRKDDTHLSVEGANLVAKLAACTTIEVAGQFAR